MILMTMIRHSVQITTKLFLQHVEADINVGLSLIARLLSDFPSEERVLFTTTRLLLGFTYPQTYISYFSNGQDISQQELEIFVEAIEQVVRVQLFYFDLQSQTITIIMIMCSSTFTSCLRSSRH